MDDPLKPAHETIFAEAIAQPAVARRGFVQRVCGEDRALAAHVLELVRGYEENSGFLETPPAGAPNAGEPPHALHEPVPGDRIGHYKLLERIGEGACGIVYMAEQEQPVRRRVALKLIKLGLDTQEFIARFEAERQALALMEHPHIARVFDAGATERGRPFFVMELVRGVPITRFCDENQLGPAARLELFISVCHAIQHAHQKGIIHRDIKPSNILVAVNDGVPVPKVIDFGIAKATQGRLTDKTLFTRFHAFIGTPAYSSPEQAEVTNLDVDTRSDIYSLGVLLYELLTGHQPVDTATIERLGFEELRRVIREVEPPRPSARVSSLGAEARTSIALRRKVDPAKLALLLRSDLDWIVMRCLEKDRRRRYETASALAEDVRRHLAHELVKARPPSAAYRLRKLYQRHRTAFLAASGIAAAIVLGLIASTTLFLRERVARARAVEAERAESELRAEAEAGRAREIKRSSRTALNLARQLLDEGKTTDGLAYLVHAARRDPENTAIAARLVSALTAHNFLLPEHAPFACGARVLALRYSHDGRSLFVGTADGVLRAFDASTGVLTREVRLGGEVKRNGWIFPRDNDTVCAVRFVGDTLGVFDLPTGTRRFLPMALDPRVLQGEGSDPAARDAGFVTFSPDGRWVLAEGLYEYWLWDASNGELKIQRTLPNFKFCAFSSDGGRFAQVSGDAVTVWSLPGCEKVFGPVPIARNHARPGVYLLPHFSRDGRELAVVDPFPSEKIHMLDAATGEYRRSWTHADYWIQPGLLQVLPDGRLLANCSHSTELWDLQTGISTPLPFTGWRNVRSWMSDAKGARVLMVSPAGFAQLVDTSSGAFVTEETALHSSGDVVAALSPDGTQVAAGSGRGELRWLRAGRGAARPLEFPALVAGFTRDGSPSIRAVSAGRSRVLAVRTGRQIGEPAPHPRAIPTGWSDPWLGPGARFLVIPVPPDQWEAWEYASDGPPRVVHLESGSEEHFFEFSPEGDFNAFFGRGAREVGVWNLATGKIVGPLAAHDGDSVGFWSVRVGAAGRVLVAGYSKGSVIVWDTLSGRPLTTLRTSSRATPNVVNLSPDGRRVAVATTFGEARVWDLDTGEPVSPVFEVAPGGAFGSHAAGAFFSADGRWLATVGTQGTMLRDASTFAPVGEVIGIRPDAPYGIIFSRDGTRLFAGGTVWDVPSGELLTGRSMLTEESHAPGGIQNVQFSPDGAYLHCQFRGASGMISRIRSLPPQLPPGSLVPEWLVQLATAIAGKAVNEAEECVPVPASTLQTDAVRRELAALPADAPYAEWGRWILDDRADRPIAPGFTISVEEAEKLAAAIE